ncbi:MAG: hypothetical protein WBB85_21700, partial [Albidovulum sp.]
VRRFRASFWSILKFIGRQVRRVLAGRFEKFGVASVSFGAPLSLAEFLTVPHEDVTAELAEEMMSRIARNVSVLPVPLIAAAIGGETELSQDELTARVGGLAARLEAAGVHLDLPDGSVEAAIRRALEILTLRKIIRREGGRITVPSKDRALIGFYAAAVEQHIAATAASETGKIPPKRGVRQPKRHKITK